MSAPDIGANLYNRLNQICNAIEFNTSPGAQSLKFAGTNINALADDLYSTKAERQTHDALTLALRNTLYQRCYAHSLSGTAAIAAVEQPSTLRAPDSAGTDDVTPRLSAANQGITRWDNGWTVHATIADGQYIVKKNNVRRIVRADEFVCAAGTSQPLVPGAVVNILNVHEAIHWQPGFYHAFSNVQDPQFETTPLVRFYWNVRVEDAAFLVSEITGNFNHYQMPFRFKCTNLCSLSQRIDTAVLYVPESQFNLALQLVMDIHQRIEHTLGIDVPLFTQILAQGLSFAQDPPGDNSFGMERCLRLATAIMHCLVRPEIDTGENPGHLFSEQVISRLKHDGLDLEKPHLTPYTHDILSSHIEEFVHDYQH